VITGAKERRRFDDQDAFRRAVAGMTDGPAALIVVSGQVGVVLGVPGQHPAGGSADVGAVEVGAEARRELGDRLLAQARVRARAARLRTFDAGVDALREPCRSMPPRSAGWVRSMSATRVI
jgi:hypothetical protein